MEKLSKDFQERQKPVAHLIVIGSVIMAWFLLKIASLFRKK